NDRPEVYASLVVDQSIDEDQPGWSYTIDDDTFFDVDNDVLTFEAALANGDPLPEWILFDAKTLTFSGTPPKNYHGSDTIVVTAFDGTEEVTTEFKLTVNAVNDDDVITGSDTTIEQNGDYGLASTESQYLITGDLAGDIALSKNGESVGSTTFKGWSAIQVEEHSEGGFMVAWRHTDGGELIWETDQSGNYQTHRYVDLADYETTFDFDFDQDGIIGAEDQTIEQNGNFGLASIGSQYMITGNPGGEIALSKNGDPADPTTSRGWSAIQVEDRPEGGFMVAWRHTDGGELIWETDQSGNYQTHRFVDLADYEVAFEFDFDLDGSIGAPEGQDDPLEAVGGSNLLYDPTGVDLPVIENDNGTDYYNI
ncbi:MAG: hypothetical protein GY742_18470, partial [Hyphomicrobiales bacterium]|nr:hypothetical protein [Hyphomicrobiales bacterium]